MKMNPKLYEALKQSMIVCAREHPIINLERYKEKHKGNDPAERYRWDLAWVCRFDLCKLYDEGLNDEHIDTALRQIVTTI